MSLSGVLRIMFLLIALTFITVLPARSPLADTIPRQLIDMGGGDNPCALLVEKSKQKLYLYANQKNTYLLLETFQCSTGENDGDKKKEGDLKTPQGVYFITRVIDGKKLPPKYGVKAFVLDYPNYVDRRVKKGGNGIWLHGTNKHVAPTDTNGCVVLRNKDILHLLRYLKPHGTPIIIVEEVEYVDKDLLVQERREIRKFIFKWRTYWEGKELTRHMTCYSRRFRSKDMDRHSWKARKMSISGRCGDICMVFQNIRLFRQKETVMALFLQGYRSDRFKDFGLKRLYLEKEGRDWKIIGEEWTALTPSLEKERIKLERALAKCGQEWR